MSLKYRDSQGNETPVAGLNGTSGELVPSTTLVLTGTISLPEQAAHSQSDMTIQLPQRMPDSDYEVFFEQTFGNQGYRIFTVHGKSIDTFALTSFNADVGVASATSVSYKVVKLMTDTVHEADSAHIAQNTANFAPAFSDVTSYAVGDYVTYNNILYRCTTAHTAGTWVAGHFTQVTVGGELSDLSYASTSLVYHQELGSNVLYNAAFYWRLSIGNVYLVHVTASDKNSPGDNYDGIIKFTYGGGAAITNIAYFKLSGTGTIDASNNNGTLQFSFASGIPEVCVTFLG